MNENLDTAEEMWVILWKAADSVQNSKNLRRLSTQTRSQKNIFQTDASSKRFNTDSRGLVTGLFGVGSRLKAAPAVPCPQTLGHL